MDLIDLLNSDEADLPRDGELDTEAQLARLFDDYLGRYRGLTADEPATVMAIHHRKNAEALATNVRAALGAWLDGHPARALAEINTGLSLVGTALKERVSVPVAAHELGPAYRIRDATDSPLPPGGIFHIPFEKRDRVGTQRYSFPGLPCLYLGRSTYGSWIECGAPAFDHVWVSKFSLAPKAFTRVLDFGRSPAAIAAMLSEEARSSTLSWRHSLAAAYAVLWPLIAACSLRRRPGTVGNFVVEYVIPQLVLRWVLEFGSRPNWAPHEPIEGIRYFSTRLDVNRTGVAAMNYAFPAMKRAPTGVCATLKSKWMLTAPCLWRTALAAGATPPNFNRVQVSLHGAVVPYSSTHFARVEGHLESLVPVLLP